MSRLVLALALVLTACVHESEVDGRPLPEPEPVVGELEKPSGALVLDRKTGNTRVTSSVAKSSGVLGDLEAGEGARAKTEESRVGSPSAVAGEGALDANLTGGVGGLIGAKGVELGAGGLGSRGAGLGGGGLSAQGVGGLGTKGMGSGKSGYGRGGSPTHGMLAKIVGTAGDSSAGVVADKWSPTSGEQYTDYGINGAVLVERDPLSTFSIDVDTASFAIARSHLQGGHLPPTSAVRVEEFINAQTYHYPPPGSEAPFAVSMEASPDPWHQGHHLLRVGVQASAPPAHRKPVNLTFLIDTSGSMSAANKLPLAIRALEELVSHLGEEDTIAIATYAGSTGIALGPTSASNADAISQALHNLRSGGGTAMGSGMTLAYQLASETLVPGRENRVIVLSDGDANIGRTSHEQMLASIQQYAKKGITLSTIGFGRGNYKDTLMEQLANKGDGNYYYIDSFKEAQVVFGTKLAGTMVTVARDVKLQVDFDPGSVISYRLIGYENRDIADKDFRNDKVDAGEIGSGHTVTALYDLVLRDTMAPTLATVRVRSKSPGVDVPAVERATELPSSAVRTSFASSSPDFKVATAVTGFAELLRGSPYAAELTYDAVAEVLRSANRGTDAELIGLVQAAGNMGREVQQVPVADTHRARSVQQAGEPLVIGALDRAGMQRVVRRDMSRVRYCYEREVARGSTSQGSLNVRLTVAADGSVSEALVKTSTLGNQALEQCVTGQFARMRFPEVSGGGVALVTYPLQFTL